MLPATYESVRDVGLVTSLFLFCIYFNTKFAIVIDRKKNRPNVFEKFTLICVMRTFCANSKGIKDVVDYKR